MTGWTADDVPDQRGRTVLVTGANSGLGLEVARTFAAKGARVLLGCRDLGRADVARTDLLRTVPHAQLEIVPLDLASLASVHSAAEQVSASNEGLDVLVNNAGLMATPFGRTEDGFEMQIGVNHLGHFALTGLLLPLLRKASAPRVVTVSSLAHQMGAVNLADLSWEHRPYKAWQAYGASKLANLLFTAELDRRASAAGLDLVAAAAHPGFAGTNLVRSTSLGRVPVLGSVAQALATVVGVSASTASQSVLYAATAPGVKGNDYVGPGGPLGRGAPAPASRAASADDTVTAAHLWERSEAMTGVIFAF